MHEIKLNLFVKKFRSCYAFTRHLFIFCVLFTITNISNAYAEKKITALKLNKKQISKTANDINNVRFSFIDLSNRKRIGVREINYWGKSTNYFELPKELLDHDAKNYRWGAALNYDTKLDCFIVGLWKRGIFRFSRKGEILAKYKYTNISHSIEILENGNLLFPFSWSTRQQRQITEIDPSGKIVWSWSAAKFIDTKNPSMHVSMREPKSFVAVTGAIALNRNTVIGTLSQANSIVFIDRESGSVTNSISENRPHAPVAKNGKLIGYTIRAENAVKLWDERCDCFKVVSVSDDNARAPGGNRRWGWSRSLSLQYLGHNQWFVSGITSLRQIDTDGNESWFLSISPNPQWTGFHKVVRYEIPSAITK